MNVVTGSFGYIGRYITRKLLESGQQVKTITTHPDKPNPFGSDVEAFPYNFDKPGDLIESLRGADRLFNTYWIRFEYGGCTFDQAVQNTRTLLSCARDAGIKRIIHVSVTNASMDSDLKYYRGKALQEAAVKESGLSYAIIRPTLVFGVEDILVNNIAWLLRRFPIFPIFGSGQYRLQPVYVGDLAATALACSQDDDPVVIDSIGPNTYSFQEFVELIARRIRPGVKLLHVPPGLGIFLGRFIDIATRDILLTDEELRGLMEEMLTSTQAPNGSTEFSDWLDQNIDRVGCSYTSELDRHFLWKP